MSRSSNHKDHVSPLERARRLAGLTLDEIAHAFGVSRGMTCHWTSGRKPPPARLYVFLAGASSAAALEAQHLAWFRTKRARTRTAATVRYVTGLPADVTPDEARERCAQALAAFATGGAR